MALSKITSSSITDTAIHGRRNLIINGNFDIWQRATSYTDVAGIWKYGHADRWNGHNDGANAGTWSQSTTVPNSGSKYSMLMTGDTGVTNTNMTQRIESINLGGIRDANSFTLSGWVRSSVAGKVINFHGLCPTALDNYAGYTQHNGLMTSVTITGNGTTFTSQITLTDANTWYYFTATKTNATSLTNFENGYAPFFSIIGQTSSSHQVYMSQLQIEPGEQATPFEHRLYGEELQLCQRYFYRYINGNSQSIMTASGILANFIQGNINFPTAMRAAPSLFASSGTDYYQLYSSNPASFNDISGQQFHTNGCTLLKNGATITAGHAAIVYSNNAAVTIDFDSEL